MTWHELSRNNLVCAQRLLDMGDDLAWRSSVSRAYYAAYCAAAGPLCAPGRLFRHGWRNPPHDDVPLLISNVAGIDETSKQAIKTRLRFLREAREDADYRPGRTIDRQSAVEALKQSGAVLRLLGVME